MPVALEAEAARAVRRRLASSAELHGAWMGRGVEEEEGLVRLSIGGALERCISASHVLAEGMPFSYVCACACACC